MVTPRGLPFWQDTRGVALSEALLTFPLVMLVFGVFVEFGFAMAQWNQTVKALQYGARLAAVSDPVVPAASFKLAFPVGAPNPLNNGKATPNDATISVTCGPYGVGCDMAKLNRIVLGSDGVCGPVGTSRPGMCDLNSTVNPKYRIKPENIVVTYQRSGLGYWGRPAGPVLTMRFEVRNLPLPVLFLGALLGLDDIPMPAHPVTLTTEDMKTCSTC